MAAMRIPILAIAFLFLLSSSFEGSEAHAPTETEPSVENVPESAVEAAPGQTKPNFLDQETLLSEYEADLSKIKDLSKLLKRLEKSLGKMKDEAKEKYKFEYFKMLGIEEDIPRPKESNKKSTIEDKIDIIAAAEENIEERVKVKKVAERNVEIKVPVKEMEIEDTETNNQNLKRREGKQKDNPEKTMKTIRQRNKERINEENKEKINEENKEKINEENKEKINEENKEKINEENKEKINEENKEKIKEDSREKIKEDSREKNNENSKENKKQNINENNKKNRKKNNVISNEEKIENSKEKNKGNRAEERNKDNKNKKNRKIENTANKEIKLKKEYNPIIAHKPKRSSNIRPSISDKISSANSPEDAEEISPVDHVAPTFEISTDDQTPNVEAAEIGSESDPQPELGLDPKFYDEAREQVPVSPEAPETASAPMEEERIPVVQQQPSVQEVPEASIPTPVPEMVVPPPPVAPVPEYTSPSPPAGNPTPVYTPPPSVQKENIINRAIYALFGINPETRDAKWAQPWNTHEEHRRAPREEKKTAAIDASPNFIGQYINKMVELAFGKVTYERDEKWAQPWQSHPEHQKKPISVSEQPAKKVYVPSEGIFHKFIVLVFGNVKGERDSKYAQPWQTHAEHKKQERIEQPSEKLAIQASGGILDKLIRVVFPTELGERDPKYAKPWQTHQEHTKSKVEESAPAKQVKAVPIGGPIDKLVKMLFNLPTDVERNPKYAQPWQTHEEHSRKQSEPKEKVVVKTTGALPGFGFVDKAIKAAFGEIPENRDEKWAQPWPTHPEHKRSAAPAKVVEKKVMPVEGGLFDGIIRSLFGLSNETKRDPKWSEPWTSHNEHRLKVSNPTPAAPQPAAPTPRPAVPASQPPTHQAAAPAHQPAAPQPAAPAPQPAAPAPQPAAPAPQPAASAPQPAASAPQPAASAPQPVAPAPAPRPAAPERQPSAPQVVSKAGTDSDEEKPTADKLEKSNEAETTQTSQEAVEKFPVEEQDDDSGEVQADISTPSTPSAVVDSAPTQDQQDGGFEEDDNQEQIILVPSSPRSRLHIDSILGLDEPSRENYRKADPIAEATLRNLMNVYASNVKPLEDTYKYNDISNRHMSDSALFGQPLVLMLGPYSTGKSSFLNYLMGIEYTRRALRTGANPSHGVFRIIQYGDSDMELDGTALSADLNFRSLQKFGQNFVDQLKGHALNVPLLKKVTFVEAPGILEMRRAGERLYPFNDVLQWFIDRADLVLVMFDYTKLDAGYELEAALDQLKGREAQVRILLNKADQIPPEELIKVQGSLFWNLSPLLGVTTPPTVYAGSFSSRPYRTSSPAQLFQAQEEALLHDIAKAVNNRVDNRVAVARRHAVRVRNHAQMVDTYLSTYNKNKGFLTSKHKLAEDIVENPHLYNIYEGMSLLTNISRYDLPDPEGYRDFFRVHNLYDFPTLKGACSFVHGCPLDKIDKAINTELPELLSRYRQQLVKAGVSFQLPQTDNFHGGRQTLPEAQHSKY